MADESGIQELKSLLMLIPFGPLDLVIYHTVIMTNASLRFQHKHGYFELHLLLKGDAFFELDGEEAHVKEGQLCWINPGVLHNVKSDPFKEMKHFVIHFDLIDRREKNNITLGELAELKLFLSSIYKKKFWVCDDRNQCFDTYQSICEEIGKQQFGYLLKTQNFLSNFIIATIQSMGIQGILHVPPVMGAYSNIAYGVISYIRRHYAEDITLASTAQALNISPRHIERVIRETFDATFNKVLTGFRVEHVKGYLCTTKYPLERIAELVGFSSVGVMRNNFERSTGITIKKYRDQVKL